MLEDTNSLDAAQTADTDRVLNWQDTDTDYLTHAIEQILLQLHEIIH